MTATVSEIGALKKARELMGNKIQEVVLAVAEGEQVGDYVLFGRAVEAIVKDTAIAGYLTDAVNSTNAVQVSDAAEQLVHQFTRTYLANLRSAMAVQTA